jgi:protein TonB
VYDRRARPDGIVGGKGNSNAKPQKKRKPPPAEDRSRPALPQSTNWSGCGFPAEADMEQIDYARVRLVVTVGTDGRAKSVVVQSDPGYGFGALARQCALRRRYKVGLDQQGNPVTRTTPPFTVTFTR